MNQTHFCQLILGYNTNLYHINSHENPLVFNLEDFQVITTLPALI